MNPNAQSSVFNEVPSSVVCSMFAAIVNTSCTAEQTCSDSLICCSVGAGSVEASCYPGKHMF